MEPREPVVTARYFRQIANDLWGMNKATVLSPYAASLTLRRTGLNFIFFANRGSAATPLHPCLRAFAPIGASNSARFARQLPIYRALEIN